MKVLARATSISIRSSFNTASSSMSVPLWSISMHRYNSTKASSCWWNWRYYLARRYAIGAWYSSCWPTLCASDSSHIVSVVLSPLSRKAISPCKSMEQFSDGLEEDIGSLTSFFLQWIRVLLSLNPSWEHDSQSRNHTIALYPPESDHVEVFQCSIWSNLQWLVSIVSWA